MSNKVNEILLRQRQKLELENEQRFEANIPGQQQQQPVTGNFINRVVKERSTKAPGAINPFDAF